MSAMFVYVCLTSLLMKPPAVPSRWPARRNVLNTSPAWHLQGAMRGQCWMVRHALIFFFLLLLTRCQTICLLTTENQSYTLLQCCCFLSLLIFLQRFHDHVLPNIEQLVGTDHIRSIHESGADLRTHLINTRQCCISVLHLKNLVLNLSCCWITWVASVL